MLSRPGRRARLFVFTYHQVLEHADPYRPGEPDQGEFASDMEIIASTFNVLPLPEAAEQLFNHSLPARAACITFDDGYENNRSIAAPILERKGLPATFFIACGAVDTGVMWNDLVIEALAACGNEIDGSGLRELDCDLRNHVKSGPLVEKVLKSLKYRSMSERWDTARRLYRKYAGEELPRLMMTRTDVKYLAQRGFDIGGHTINHPILNTLDPESARAEIAGCRDWIYEVTGQEPRTFAYPNGIPGRDFHLEHEQMVRESGFEVAVSTDWAVAGALYSPYCVPRLGPWWRQGRSLSSGLVRAYLRSYV